jgi:hypothetical protein
MRIAYGLPPITDFANITRNQFVNSAVQSLYANNISNIDFFVGGMLESQQKPGPLFELIFKDVL